MFLCHVHAWCLQKQGEGVRSPRTGVRDSCASPCGYWELNPDPLREQVLSITDPSLQPNIIMCGSWCKAVFGGNIHGLSDADLVKKDKLLFVKCLFIIQKQNKKQN